MRRFCEVFWTVKGRPGPSASVVFVCDVFRSPSPSVEVGNADWVELSTKGIFGSGCLIDPFGNEAGIGKVAVSGTGTCRDES